MVLILIERLLSLFTIVLCGYGLVKFKLVEYKDSRVLSVISIYLITPAVILHSFQIDYTPKIRDNFLLAIMAGVLSHAIMLLVNFILKKLMRLNVVEQASLIYTNAANLIIPLIVSLFGEEWVVYSSAFIMVQLFLFWTHGLYLFSGKNQFDLRSFLTNLNLVSIIIGALSFFLQIKIPKIIDNSLASLALTIGPIAMLLLGMIIASSKYGVKYWSFRTLQFIVIKVFILPLIITLTLKMLNGMHLVTDSRIVLTISLLAAVAPSGVTIIQMAQLYDRNVEEASILNLLTTILSVVSIPLMVGIFNY